MLLLLLLCFVLFLLVIVVYNHNVRRYLSRTAIGYSALSVVMTVVTSGPAEFCGKSLSDKHLLRRVPGNSVLDISWKSVQGGCSFVVMVPQFQGLSRKGKEGPSKTIASFTIRLSIEPCFWVRLSPFPVTVAFFQVYRFHAILVVTIASW